MDYTPLLQRTRESHDWIMELKLHARLLIAAGDPLPALMATAYERLNSGLNIVAICTRRDEVETLILEQKPDTAIVCSDLEVGDGSQLVAEIKQQYPHIKVMLLGRSLRSEPYRAAWESNCEVIAMRRKSGGGRLFIAYRALFQGGSYCDPEIQHDLENKRTSHAAKDLLTQRELEVLNEVVYGQGNSQIAERLRISEPTVKQHISTLFSKLDVRSRSHLATRALRLGLSSWGVADELIPTFDGCVSTQV